MRGRGTWAWGLGLLVAAVGCMPNTGGVGASSAASLGDDGSEDGDPPSTSAEAGSAGTSNGEGGATSQVTTVDDGPMTGADATSGDPATTSAGGAALLVLSDVPQFDYGNVAPGNQTAHTFTLTNEGDAEATGISSMSMAAPFNVTGGTCSASLTTNTSCTIDVSFAPADLGPYSGGLSVTHDDGEVSCDLLGSATGQSGNLILNPGGEAFGNPPQSWSNVGSGAWVAGPAEAGSPAVWAGSGYLAASAGPDSQAYVLRQDVSVSQWSSLIDQGLLRLSFQGEARSQDFENDFHRIRIQYRDGGNVLDTWDTDWQGASTVQLYTVDRIPPAGTRTVRVDLFCVKYWGTVCDAFYDQLDLRASYP